jgi:hypothetical protein
MILTVYYDILMWTNVKLSYQLSHYNHVANQNLVPSKLAIQPYLRYSGQSTNLRS